MNNNYGPPPEGKDPVLWELAQRRTSFKSHFRTYLIIIGFLWLLWFFTGQRSWNYGNTPWPIWPTLGWGIGLLFHYFNAYHGSKGNGVEREYEKLKSNKN